MNLENLNLVELNALEVQEVEGGGWLDGLKHIFSLMAAAHEGCRGHRGSLINQGGVVIAEYKVH